MLSSGPPHPVMALYLHILPPHSPGVILFTHTSIATLPMRNVLSVADSPLQPSSPLNLLCWHLLAGHLVVKSNPIQLQWTFWSFFTCAASLSLWNKLPSSLLLWPVTSSSFPILHIFTLLVIPPERPSAGVSQCNSTNSSGVLPIHKRGVSVLVPLKANIFYLTSKNLQPGPSTSTAFITVISCPLRSPNRHTLSNARNLLKFLPGP